ncbi:MAG: pyridoxamine 5'-phosphate oxidase family protein [Candidatus Binataceae bacterium]
MRAFLARQEMMFVATSDAKGATDSGFRGASEIRQSANERTIAYPEYRGNSVTASLVNISENPHVGLLFVDFSDQIGFAYQRRRANPRER